MKKRDRLRNRPAEVAGKRLPLPRSAVILLCVALLLGAALRNVWLSDMEYKWDERWMFENVRENAPWSWLGMISSSGIANPGMSVWVFAAPAQLLEISDPVDLARVVAVLASAAIGLLMVFAARRFSPPEREPWLWAAALVAVNPGAVLLQRKIWSPSTLPVFSLGALAAWSCRRTPWGALAWGALGACLGQIHMGGFFFVLAFVLWTALFDRQPDAQGRRVRWGFWVLGSALAAWPLVPWALAILGGQAGTRHPLDPLEALRFSFYRNWFSDLLALHPRYSLGPQDFQDWLAWPRLLSHPSWAVLALYLVAFAGAGLALAFGLHALWKARGGFQERLTSAAPGALAQNAAFLGFGAIMTVTAQPVYPHYLLVAFPLTYLWLARAALCRPRLGRVVLAGLFAVHAFLSAGVLTYLHLRGGAPAGDYGVSYSHQPRR